MKTIKKKEVRKVIIDTLENSLSAYNINTTSKKTRKLLKKASQDIAKQIKSELTQSSRKQLVAA